MRFTNEGLALMEAVSRKLGISRTAVAEMGVRRIAEQNGITLGTPQKSSER